MKRLFAGLLALMLLLTGCGRKIDNSAYVPTGDAILMEGQEPEDILPEEEDTQELRLAYYPDRMLNPVLGSDYTNRVLMSLMYQGLFAVDSKKNPTPMLCSGYQVSSNRRSWTFYIDANATFSDGSKVTAQDVVATYTKAKESDYYGNRFVKHLLEVSVTADGGVLFQMDTAYGNLAQDVVATYTKAKESDYYGNRFVKHLLEVSVTADGGVLFQMDTAYGNLPLILDVPIVKASEVDSELPLGSGPYIFTQGTGGAKLQRNLNWWCGDLKIPATDEIIDLVEVASPAEVRDAFQFGENTVSVVCTNPMSDSFAEYRCDYELWEIESGYMMYLGCNIGYSDFFEDGTLRTALTYAIDRETLAQENYKGLVDAVTLPCSPEVSFYSKSLANKFGTLRTALTYAIDRETLAQENYKGLVDAVTLPCSPEVSFYSKSLANKFTYDPLRFVSFLNGYNIPRKDGKTREMTLLVNSQDSARTRIARSIAASLTELGLPTKTQESGGVTYKNTIVNANYDVYLGMTRLSPNMDLTEFFRDWGEMSWGQLNVASLYDMCNMALQNEGNERCLSV